MPRVYITVLRLRSVAPTANVMDVMQSAMEEFDAVARRLLQMPEGRATAAELVERVRAVAVDASRGLPPVLVLYNDCYGCFGLSDAFLEFTGTRRGSGSESNGSTDVSPYITSRTFDQDVRATLRRFAAATLARCPELDRVLRAFCKFRLGEVYGAAVELEARVRNRAKLASKAERIERLLTSSAPLLDAPDASEDKTKWPCSLAVLEHCTDAYLERFDAEQLRELLRRAREALARTDGGQELVHDPALLEPLRAAYADARIEQGVLEDALRAAALFRRQEREKMSKEVADARLAGLGRLGAHLLRMEAEQDVGRAFADVALGGRLEWDAQHFFPTPLMSFATWLVHGGHAMSEWAADADIDDYELAGRRVDCSRGWANGESLRDQDALELAGRLLASGRYARLAVAEVPALADWTIGEHDGLETTFSLGGTGGASPPAGPEQKLDQNALAPEGS